MRRPAPHPPHIPLLLLLLALLLAGCTTQRNTVVTRTFHHITSRYNYFHNARESFDQGMRRAVETVRYDYTRRLPVFIAGLPQLTSAVGGDMDRVIMKCTEMIARHSITVKPERPRGTMTARQQRFHSQNEFVRWAREGWLLIGKARVWKGELSPAGQTFEHISLQLPNTRVWFEAQVWLARIDLLNNDLISASDRLRIISANRSAPDTRPFRHLLHSTWAELHLRQGNLAEGERHLARALDDAPNRHYRLRYSFILGQLRAQQGDYAQAVRLFRQVIRMNPPHEMVFNARISIASALHHAGQGQGMKRQLLRMASDDKNVDYLDQLYFALGNIERSEGNMAQAIAYFQLSARKSVSNPTQKGLSYLTLAEHFFAQPDYVLAEAYYDSAYHALDETFPGFEALRAKTQHLNRLITNLNTVTHQDSLLRVARMRPQERDALIAALIRRVRDQEELQRRAEQEERERFMHFQQSQRFAGPQALGEASRWYFYNPASLSLGQSEFQARWGRRQLEDNWRRRNRAVSTLDAMPGASPEEAAAAAPTKVMDNKTREYYMQNLPLTDSLQQVAHRLIVEALFRAADIFQNNLQDYTQATAKYLQIARRYPNSDHALRAYYNLYQIHRFLEDPVRTQEYKQIIVRQFPSSTYALMLSDPNYIEDLRRKAQAQRKRYEDTYALFLADRCAEVIARATEELRGDNPSELAPKYRLLLALCTGRTQGLTAYIQRLTEVVEHHPNTPQAQAAREMLESLSRQELQLAAAPPPGPAPARPGVAPPTSLYQPPSGPHLFIALVPRPAPLNQLRFNVVTFNVDHFLNLNLTVRNTPLNEFTEVIVVEPFRTLAEARTYLQQAQATEGLLSPLNPGDYTLLIISQTNLEILLRERSAPGYIEFFRTNY